MARICLRTIARISNPCPQQNFDGYQYIKAGSASAALQFFPTAEGYINYDSGVFKYVFNYTDHLGNIRLSYTRDNATGLPVIMEENHYYPFGLKHTNYNVGILKLRGSEPITASTALRKYKYNGKEWQDELGLNIYDYGARNYDPAIGRWPCVDPQAELLERSSPYAYALNSPLVYVDNDGELPILINGKTASDSERADVSYWTASIVNTIKNSGIANPGGEVHFVDGNRGHSWSGKSGGYATQYDNVTAPSRRAQGGRYAADGDWKGILSKLARDPETGNNRKNTNLYT